MPDIRLIATDLDGTLLGSAHAVPPRAFPLIEKLVDRDIAFFAASGRQHASLRRLFAPVADRIGYVCENGALAIYRGEVLHESEFPRERALALADAIAEHPACNLIVSGRSTAYALADGPEFIEYLVDVVGNDVVPIERFDRIDEPILKMAFQVPEEERPGIEAHFDAIVGEGFRVITSGSTWLDVLQDGVNKGTALAAVGAALGIDASRMAAFGDNENDREMLTCVGHPYLMDDCNPSMLDLVPPAVRCGSVVGELECLLGR